MNQISLRRKDMKKAIAVLCLLVFVQFTAIYAFSPELLLKDFSLDKEDASESDIRPFSLKTAYSPELKIADPVLFSAQGTDDEVDIKKLKSKRMWSWVGAVAFAGLGGWLIYEFANYESGTTSSQEGEKSGHTETKSLGQYGLIIGGLLSFGVTALLISSAVKQSKIIKEYEAELKAAAAYSRR
jgi:hypothetical protein